MTYLKDQSWLILINLYISELHETYGNKSGNVNYLALAVQHKGFEPTEIILTNDLSKIYANSSTKLIPNQNKMELKYFHSNIGRTSH